MAKVSEAAVKMDVAVAVSPAELARIAREAETGEVARLLALEPAGKAAVLAFSGSGGNSLSINVEGRSGWYLGQNQGGAEIKAIALTGAPDGVVVVWKGIRNDNPGQRPVGGPRPEPKLYRTWFGSTLVSNVKLLE